MLERIQWSTILNKFSLFQQKSHNWVNSAQNEPTTFAGCEMQAVIFFFLINQKGRTSLCSLTDLQLKIANKWTLNKMYL